MIDLTFGFGLVEVSTITFNAYVGKEEELRAKGVRVFPGKRVTEDFEPEYIAVSPDSKTAFVTLQEANAFAVLEIPKASFVDIIPLGYKDYSRGPAQLKQYNFNEPAIGQKQNGDPILFGGLSGLFFEKEENGQYIFVTVPDRGPNGEESPNGRPFLKPDYVAEVIRFALDKNTGAISILEKTPLKRKDGDQLKAITGFPNIPGVDEKPIDEAGNLLPYDPFGADLEGVAVAKDGSYWMVDEYRPAIYHFGKDGVLLNRFVPKGTAALASPAQPAGTYGEETLPAEYAKRRSNRGFEAMALDAEQNILYAFIQTPLANPNRAASDNSNIIRIVGINPENGTPVAEYLYVLEKPNLRLTNVDKMGDATYDAKTKTFYAVERDDEAKPENKKYIFQFDLKGATNLLAAGAPALPAGKTLEQSTVDELAALGIKPVKKTKVLNLPSIGYLPGDKVEGLTLLPDGSLAVINDNDFGVNGPDLATVGLGIITFSKGNTLDASDRDNGINLQNWPVKGAYMPDAVATFQANGKTYYVTANEGDVRNEDARVGSLNLDPTAFPDASLKNPEQLGRLTVSKIDADTDGDGDYDQLVAYGARSFTIWDAYGNRVYDSGDEFEKITAIDFPKFFNSNNDANNFDVRSDDKGPEPEGVVTGTLNGRTYAFVGLERIGGIMVYDVTHPDQSQFVQYFNNRNFAGDPKAGTAGDLGPEGLVFINAKESPNGQPLLVVANEVSGTTSIFGVSKPQSIISYTLVNADTDEDITTLKDGALIDFAQLATTRLNIRANVSPDTVGSVVFQLNSEVFSTENFAYYALAGNNDSDYQAWTPEAGEFTLTATPYSEASDKGTAGIPLTISFTVVNSAKINRLVLVDARTAADLREIKEDDVINLRNLPGKQVNIRAETAPQQVGSVKFNFTGPETEANRTENFLPYALFGDTNQGSEYLPFDLKVGKYRLQATPYTEAEGKGAAGAMKEITFEVVDEPAVAKLFLVDVTKNKVLTEIREGDVINLSALGVTAATNLNIQAETSPRRMVKVEFSLNEKEIYAADTQQPYELFGDEGAVGKGWKPVDGKYLVKATPYFKKGGKMEAGTAYAVNFSLVTTQPGASTARVAAAGSQKGVNPEGQPWQVSVSPNPVRDQLTLQFSKSLTGPVTVKVYDVMGRKTYFETETMLNGEQSIQLNLGGLPSRFYLLKVYTHRAQQVVKIVKE